MAIDRIPDAHLPATWFAPQELAATGFDEAHQTAIRPPDSVVSSGGMLVRTVLTAHDSAIVTRNAANLIEINLVEVEGRPHQIVVEETRGLLAKLAFIMPNTAENMAPLTVDALSSDATTILPGQVCIAASDIINPRVTEVSLRNEPVTAQIIERKVAEDGISRIFDILDQIKQHTTLIGTADGFNEKGLTESTPTAIFDSLVATGGQEKYSVTTAIVADADERRVLIVPATKHELERLTRTILGWVTIQPNDTVIVSGANTYSSNPDMPDYPGVVLVTNHPAKASAVHPPFEIEEIRDDSYVRQEVAAVEDSGHPDASFGVEPVSPIVVFDDETYELLFPKGRRFMRRS